MEEDMMQDHRHTVHDYGHSHSYYDYKFTKYFHFNDAWLWFKAGTHKKVLFSDMERTTYKSYTDISVNGVTSAYRSGSETRPKNMNAVYIMRVY